MAPGDLDKALSGFDFPTNPNVLVGLDRADDAGVYKITDEIAIVQSVDFFTPVVDDPYWFGQISAANALSNLYAMGAMPKTAMNLVGFPAQQMKISVLRQILDGSMAKLREAGVVLMGGHSLEDKELKYGLAVTGLVHPDRVLTKKDIRLGDRLLLTKPLGTGIITTAMKAEMVSEDLIDLATLLMAALNRDAAEVMERFPVHACTDVSGFGLLGNLSEMVEGSGLGARLFADQIPLMPDVLDFAETGLIPVRTHRNREFRKRMVQITASVSRFMKFVLFDPQISGGLLICVDNDSADDMLIELRRNGINSSAIIGEVVAEPVEKILVV